MYPSNYEGRRMDYMRGQGIMRQELQKTGADRLTADELQRKMCEITDCVACSAGACSELTTGNTLAILAEGMGIALPRSSTSTAVSAEKTWHAKQTGEAILDL